MRVGSQMESQSSPLAYTMLFLGVCLVMYLRLSKSSRVCTRPKSPLQPTELILPLGKQIRPDHFFKSPPEDEEQTLSVNYDYPSIFELGVQTRSRHQTRTPIKI
jgi:hypothetical protein